MKKLMIAAAITCAAAVSNAATYYWNFSSGDEVVHAAGSNYGAALESGTPAYVFMLTADFTQESVLTAVRNKQALSSLGAVTTLEVGADGKVAAPSTPTTTTALSEGDEQYFFLAIQDGNNLLLTDKAGGIGTINILDPIYASMYTDYPSGDEYAMWGEKTWAQSDGWGGYFSTAAATPEPTSGLLLLLGVAGLALKRKRA